MDVTVRPAVDSDIPALHGLHAAQNDFGGRWFTNPFTGGKEVSFEDLNPAQRWLHGGPWMDPQLLSLHIRRYADAGGAVLVAERAETIVGSIELWPSEEPLPFGRYLDVEMLVAYPPGHEVIERALIDAALREAQARDLRALDIAPLHSGGSEPFLTRLGFLVLTEHRTVHLATDRRPKAPDYSVLNTAPAYADLREFLAVNHREPAGFRVGSLGNAWASGLLKDVSHPYSGLLQVGVFPIGVTGRICIWLPEQEAEVDLWVPTKALGNLPWFLTAMSAAIDYVAKHHRIALFRATVAAHLVDSLRALGFEGGDEPDPWLRNHLLARVLSPNRVM